MGDAVRKKKDAAFLLTHWSAQNRPALSGLEPAAPRSQAQASAARLPRQTETAESSGSGDPVSSGTTSKSGSAPILKCPTQFPLILWHPSARHYYFCMMTEAEQDKWHAVLQDCIRHCNNGETPAGPGVAGGRPRR